MPDEAIKDTKIYCSVYFRVVIPVADGESVRVCGSCDELKNWDFNLSVGLEFEPNIPCWFSLEPVNLPISKEINYKYVIFDSDGNFQRWEDTHENRTFIPTGLAMIVEDDEGVGRSYNLPPYTLLSELHATKDFNFNEMTKHSYKNPSKKTPMELIRLVRENEQFTPPHDNATLIIVSFELPVKVIKNQDGNFELQKQNFLVLPQLHALRSQFSLPVRFFGWPHINPENDEEKQKIEELLEPHQCVPVFIPPEDLNNFLNFTYLCLQPLFHNVLIHDDRPFEGSIVDEWCCYQHINRLYANAVVFQAHESDIIWVHDIPLILVAQYISRRIHNVNIGFFLHTPFPSSEIFRSSPLREPILRALLFNDLIGFHFFEYARHFLVANKRQLNVDHQLRCGGFLQLDYGGRHVMIRIKHVHIQYDELKESIDNNKSILTEIKQLQDLYKNRFIFASIDRCDDLSGIHLKLEGFLEFLENTPQAYEKCTLVQYVYPAAYVPHTFESYAEKFIAFKNKINDKFSCNCVHLEIRSFTPDEKHALFAAADCFVNTSIRDGLNLNPFEFICCRHNKPAPLILSEFIGCCRTLASAIQINPWNRSQLASAFKTALMLPPDIMKALFEKDQIYLKQSSTLRWAEDFLADLQRARKKEDHVYIAWGFGQSYRVIGMDLDFQYLDCNKVIQACRTAKRKVFFFDHEGTLALDKRRVTAIPGYEDLYAVGAAPGTRVKQCLTALCAAGNIVVILSGRNQELLSEWFQDIPNIGLCAEHGFYYKLPQLTGDEWKCVTSVEPDLTWKSGAMELMRQYVKRTQGAFIENKGSALVFQYRNADPDFGSWQAKELANYLQELLLGSPVTVVCGKGYVEVKLFGVDKGQAVSKLLNILTKVDSENMIDFILCVGDDRSDESMYPEVNSFFHSKTSLLPISSGTNRNVKSYNDLKLTKLNLNKNNRSYVKSLSSKGNSKIKLPVSFTVTVGKKPSSAKNYLNDVEEVSDLLQALAFPKVNIEN